MTHIRLDIDWFLRLCDHVRYHADAVDTGVTRQRNKQYPADKLGLEPANLYHQGWYLNACGLEFCYEIIDSSFTIGRVDDTQYILSGIKWSVHFKTFGSRSSAAEFMFQGRWVYPHVEYFSGDPDEFDRQRMMIEIVLPMRESVYWTNAMWPRYSANTKSLGVWDIEIR